MAPPAIVRSHHRAAVARVSAFDAAAVEQALRDARAELVIDELTSLPKDPSEMAAAAPGDRKLKIEGGGNLHRAALASGVRRYVQQASGFFLEPGVGLADEFAGLAVDGSPHVAASERAYAELEARVLNAGEMEGSSCGTGSSTGRARGTTRTGQVPIRSAGRRSRSSETAAPSGRGSRSRTRRSPPHTARAGPQSSLG